MGWRDARARLRHHDLVGAGWTVLRFTSTTTTPEIVATLSPLLFGR